MTYLYATLHTLSATWATWADTARTRHRDRGASTLETVFWAVGLLALAGVVYAAIQAYITTKIPNIR